MLLDTCTLTELFSWLFYSDEKYAALFEEGHWMYYSLEYVVFPAFLFYLIFRMIRKEERSAHFAYVSRFLEIFARNWGELSLIFLLSWIAFELRVKSDLHYHQTDITSSLISPAYLSQLTFFFSLAFFLIYYIVLIKVPPKFADKQTTGTVIQIQMAAVPIFLSLHLVLIVLLYYMPVLRIMISAIFFIGSIVYTSKLRYTPGMLWDEAKRISTLGATNKSIELTILAISYFLESSKKIRFKTNLHRKSHYLLDATNQCLFLGSEFGIGKERPDSKTIIEKTENEIERCKKYAGKIKDTELKHLLEKALAEIRKMFK